MLIVHKRLKTEPDAEWEFHELSSDKFPGGFERESELGSKIQKKKHRP